jgi:hypothetical protein
MAFCILPFSLFLVATAASAASFYAHVYLDKEYHVQAPKLARFARFRHKQQGRVPSGGVGAVGK